MAKVTDFPASWFRKGQGLRAEVGRAGIFILGEETMNAEAKQVGKVKCAWCGADLGEKEGVEGISHGICPSCAARLQATLPEESYQLHH